VGFAISYASLIALEHSPSGALLYIMVFSQGFLGYALTSVMGPIVAEIFEGPQYGTIFGTITIALIGGGAAGPWMAGAIHDSTNSYRLAFILIIACCLISAAVIWIAAPRKVRVGSMTFRAITIRCGRPTWRPESCNFTWPPPQPFPAVLVPDP
jgi:MFS family permease